MSEVFWSAFGGGITGGMVAAFAGLVVEWGRYCFSKSHLKVSGTSRYVITPGTSSKLIGIENDDEIKLVLVAANDRQHLITVTGFGIRLKGSATPGLFLIPNEGFHMPYEILPGHNLTQFTSVPDLVVELKRMGKKPRDLKCIWFNTATDQEFRGAIDKSVMRAIRTEYNNDVG